MYMYYCNVKRVPGTPIRVIRNSILWLRINKSYILIIMVFVNTNHIGSLKLGLLGFIGY